jgi:DNA (cytosine-5)-methyltransferase 1
VLRVAGLFAGIGGIELGFEQAGHRTVILCEKDPAAVNVLEVRFPSIEIVDDVTAITALPTADVITAGFPCQDLSPRPAGRPVSTGSDQGW